MKPVTNYTKSGRINIAYQVFGSGKVDLVYIPGWVSNIDWMWACPELVSFLEELGTIARVILFDKRGTGLSDRIMELSTLEERMDDIRAVMDAVGSERAILFGHSEGGAVSALFAATYPGRVISLITFGIFAKRRYAREYPWAPTDEDRQQVYDMIESSWGSGRMNLESLAPSKANDREFMDWLANYFRSGASPSAAMVLTRMNTQVDIIDILGSINVPALIMQRTHDIDVKIEEGRFIANRIKGAQFIELEGSDHLFWAGNTREVLDHMKSFILDDQPARFTQAQLFTIVAAHFNAPEKSAASLKQLIEKTVAQHRGNMIKDVQDRFYVTFEGPSKAIHCFVELIDMFRDRNVILSAGMHIKELTIGEANFVSDKTAQLMEAILAEAMPNQILITQTVKYLLSGAGLQISQQKSIFDPASGEPLFLFQVTDHVHLNTGSSPISRNSYQHSDSFLENVLRCIDSNLGNELFGVENLCREIGISERQLQRKLKAITNKSPNQLISSVRLHRAREIIIRNQHNISEVAYQMGFSSPTYFAKSFKKEFGISPSALTNATS